MQPIRFRLFEFQTNENETQTVDEPRLNNFNSHRRTKYGPDSSYLDVTIVFSLL